MTVNRHDLQRAKKPLFVSPRTDGKTEGGVISKEIKRIFQRVGEIIDENQKKNGPERYLEELQPAQEEGIKELHLGPHVDCDKRGSLRTMSGDGLGYYRKRDW